MEQEHVQVEGAKLNSHEEELQYLRVESAKKEDQLWQEQGSASPEGAISATITEYGKSTPTEKLEEHLIVENPQFESVVEHIGSLPHREKMRELYRVLAEKGVLNSIKVAQALGNPHIEDDFHRVLVEYVRNGAIVPGLEKERALSVLLHMVVFEVTLPFAGMQEGEQMLAFQEVIGEMERFFVGMTPMEGASKTNYGHFSLELVLSNFSNDIVFYVGVPEHMKDLFVKQILGSFPIAKIEECPGDYNIFNEFGASVASFGEMTDQFVFPIKTGGESEQDPFTVILNSFTKIERDGEGAAIQLVVYPDSDRISQKVKHAVDQIHQGVPVKTATNIPLSTGGAIMKGFSEFIRSNASDKKKNILPDPKNEAAKEKALQLIEEKIAAPLLRANLRLVVSAPTKERADAIRVSIESAFNQFARPQSNGIKFTHAEKGRLKELLHDFTFRSPNDNETLVFNTKELATLYHFPMHVSQKDAPQLKTVKASSAPAPSDLPSEGTMIGINKYRGEEHEIRLTKPDRLRHLYVIGQTGTGKSVFLKSLMLQDIAAGSGACFIDPHGSDVQEVLAAIPKERIEDVIYFDPSYMPRPYALNMLEYDPEHPEQKIFVVNEMLAIFKKIYSSSPESMGPAFEQYFRNATMLVMDDPETGNTLLDIPRVLADANFRNLKLSRCKNPLVVQFWRDIATKTSGEAGMQNMIPYITNKFDIFIQNDIMRPIIAQEKSSFNFREIMDNKKILLVNLAKGKLGEMNANLLGLIIIGKFLMAAMSRVDSFGVKLPDFYLYVDEFQNVATPSISAILSEARKYGLSLNLAHQFIAQLPEDIKGAVFGNVGNMVTFRVGTEDAQFLESQYFPTFKAADIMKIENLNAYAKILINGKPVPPFNIFIPYPSRGNPEILESLKNLSYLKYGKDRKVVDQMIMKRYTTPSSGTVTQSAPKPQATVGSSAGTPPISSAVRPTPTSTSLQAMLHQRAQGAPDTPAAGTIGSLPSQYLVPDAGVSPMSVAAGSSPGVAQVPPVQPTTVVSQAMPPVAVVPPPVDSAPPTLKSADQFVSASQPLGQGVPVLQPQETVVPPSSFPPPPAQTSQDVLSAVPSPRVSAPVSSPVYATQTPTPSVAPFVPLSSPRTFGGDPLHSVNSVAPVVSPSVVSSPLLQEVSPVGASLSLDTAASASLPPDLPPGAPLPTPQSEGQGIPVLQPQEAVVRAPIAPSLETSVVLPGVQTPLPHTIPPEANRPQPVTSFELSSMPPRVKRMGEQ